MTFPKSIRLDQLRSRLVGGIVALAGAAVLAFPAQLLAQAAGGVERDTVATWAAPMVSAAASTPNRIANQTLRQVARISLGGSQVRVKLSNRWNTLPLELGGASVALRTTDSGIDAASRRTLTFSGSPTFTIPAGAELLSDWVTLPVADLAELAIDMYLPGDTLTAGSVLTVRNGALQTNYLSSEGNHVGSTAFPVQSTRNVWNFLAAIDVVNPAQRGTVVAFGDSITEGLRSTLNANRRYPDVLAARLLQNNRMGVVNLGISGNRVAQGGGSTNPSALARMDRDVIVQTGASHVIVKLGINDANGGTSAEDIIAALQQVIVRARTQQLKIYVGTLTPFGNATDVVEARRTAINSWIRTTREHDGFIDFDAAIRDPANPRRMLPIYDSGDTLHPSDAGYEAMGNAIDLNLFR